MAWVAHNKPGFETRRRDKELRMESLLKGVSINAKNDTDCDLRLHCLPEVPFFLLKPLIQDPSRIGHCAQSETPATAPCPICYICCETIGSLGAQTQPLQIICPKAMRVLFILRSKPVEEQHM